MADITDKHGKIYTNPHPKITIMVSDERRPWTNQILIVQEIILTHAVETWTGTYKYQCFYLLSRSWKYGVGSFSKNKNQAKTFIFFEIYYETFYLNADFLIDRLGKRDPHENLIAMG